MASNMEFADFTTMKNITKLKELVIPLPIERVAIEKSSLELEWIR
jgi:hypothetical protein